MLAKTIINRRNCNNERKRCEEKEDRKEKRLEGDYRRRAAQLRISRCNACRRAIVIGCTAGGATDCLIKPMNHRGPAGNMESGDAALPGIIAGTKEN
ncbi:MAG: hypothetical protein A4E48_00746 [Methanosaeta sp. PtaU1.Bin060]|nr:MAG: hypothetical protein A4E48_00746 [Methanosaeta sp. PtaU1.Bin060]